MKTDTPITGPSSMEYCDVKSQLTRYIQERSEAAFSRGDATRDTLQTVEALEDYRTDARERFITAMGGLPASAPSLDPRITGHFEADGYRVENVVFTSRPDIHVTANLYLPAGQQTPGGAVLLLCGHAPTSKQHPDYLNVCRHLIGAGLVVLIMDPTGQGERISFSEPLDPDPTLEAPTWEHSYIGCRCLPLGQSFARYFLHDAMRAIDYLCTRPEVDPHRIGAAGSSGGSTQTCMLMLTDPRLAAAAPVNFLTSRRAYLYTGGAQDAEQIWPGFSADGFDHENFLAAMAPRPVLVCAADSDFFPIEGTRATVERSRRFWELHEAEDQLQLFVDQAPHRFTTPQAQHVAAFFAHHLNGVTVNANSHLPQSPEISALRVTKTGQVMTSFADARDAIDDNTDRLNELAHQRDSLDEPTRRDRALTWLRDVVYAHRHPCEAIPRCYATAERDGISVSKYLWWSQPGLMNHGLCFQESSLPEPSEDRPITLAVWEGGTAAVSHHLDWIRETCAQGRNVWVLDISGTGELEPHPINARPLHGLFGTVYRLADDLIWLNDSLVALRVYDVLRALEMIPGLDGNSATDIHLHAHDRHGIYARLAAVLDNRVQQIESDHAFGSFDAWIRPRCYNEQDTKEFILPGVLQFFDLPDIDRWLGSRLKQEIPTSHEP